MSGMDYKVFVDFLTVIAKPRLDFLQHHNLPETQSVFGEWLKAVSSSEEHDTIKYCEYDIEMIRKCADMIKCEETFCELCDESLKLKLDELLTQIANIVTAVKGGLSTIS